MFVIAASAAFVGLVHSLAPGHWLPVVLTVKTRRWPIRTAILGAITAATGHVVISGLLGVVSIFIGAAFLSSREEQIEHYGGLILLVFGLSYAAFSYFRHSGCGHAHSHHGVDPNTSAKGRIAPFAFLFSLGFSPCVAVLPVFVAASMHGTAATLITVAAFSGGVLTSFIGATVLTSMGLMKLDHPVFEHYGDVITGVGVAVMGVILYFI